MRVTIDQEALGAVARDLEATAAAVGEVASALRGGGHAAMPPATWQLVASAVDAATTALAAVVDDLGREAVDLRHRAACCGGSAEGVSGGLPALVLDLWSSPTGTLAPTTPTAQPAADPIEVALANAIRDWQADDGTVVIGGGAYAEYAGLGVGPSAGGMVTLDAMALSNLWTTHLPTGPEAPFMTDVIAMLAAPRSSAPGVQHPFYYYKNDVAMQLAHPDGYGEPLNMVPANSPWTEPTVES